MTYFFDFPTNPCILSFMKNHVLIFDFDGTIADTFQFILDLSEQLAKDFHFKKIKPQEIDQLKNNTLTQTIQHLNIPILKIPLILARTRKEIHKNITQIEPIKGLADVLLQIKNLDIKMGILSSNSTKNIKKFLKNHNLDLFDFINSSSKLWGKNHSLTRIIKRNRLPFKKILYVGDETRDIEAAKKIGIKSIAVTWGYNSAKALKAKKPDYLVHTPKQLIQLFS